ncbi:TPA: fatty acid kinase catalytic subunit FakA [Staphylococcus aureus]|uniref:fatty acid kinase catalytic subunit FakA n=1 Tax=Staphylococcus aureus TaxID=1280 RepID=UPI0001DD9188|nr:fatty acid kinase catalytic subunit FakA [Staphylococcus aureus]HDJ6916099.1 fatty acid kinase catalytic subunit FakA [Staphylococcus aureus Sa_TPS3169]HDJ6919395.1 fatty acid kinase catalytic subunit FakA [Staphylococcus aureus Sa_TPS3162]HDJ6927226.1 fatty acid kinase catalytic subunit FakA [Staphylococcus aureus Sa_TPS3157]HDJ6936268.1 fatty acid kinase catalytic subunit FakA [Staphylococcus aureus Sa_TPS3161]HDJ6941237.1 fatty acid kinase catalytic subunit FakA [Staphylococcus aureus Sa
MISKINGKLFADMIIQGAQNLSNNADLVDSLNVYPVPDGDTGTNMNLTMTSGREEVENNLSKNIGELGKTFSKGLLMGARGNSGVILSQLFRGFCKNIESESEINSKLLAESFQAGVETAYKAVMKPVEGTILTVAKDAAQAAVEKANNTEDCIELMEYIIVKANESLENTPNLLAVLKEVGVVDSGGKGLLCVYEGFLKALKGEKVEAKVAKLDKDEFVHDEHDFHGVINTEDIIYGYCTEMMVRFGKNKKAFDEQEFRQDMSQFGDSLLVINDEEIVKVHVHTEYPGKVFNYGQQYGELIKLKVENMREQHREVIRKEQHSAKPKMETVETAIITISMGEGISEIFKSMGATHIISGGQTMNPSTEDIVKVIEQSKCKRAIILPNNKNILMASEQAASIVDAEAVVIPTKSIPQGISALFQYDVDATLEENKAQMADSVNNVKSGSLTYAVRDTKIDGVEIKKDAFMGLIEDKIVSSQSDQLTTVTELLNEMLAEDSEILTVIIGQDAEQAVTDNMINWIEEQYPDVEVEVHEGGQPIYQYFFSVE